MQVALSCDHDWSSTSDSIFYYVQRFCTTAVKVRVYCTTYCNACSFVEYYTLRCGGGLFLACEDFGRIFDHLFPACAFFVFVFEMEISSRTLISPLRPGSVHSGSASWDDCGRMFPDKLCLSSFPDRFHTLCLNNGIVSPLRLRWVKGVCVFQFKLPPALFARMTGVFYKPLW